MTDTATPVSNVPTDPNVAASLGLLRQVLLAIGVLLAGHGVIGPNNTITPANWQFIVGVLVTLAPVVWSAWEKFRVAKTIQQKEVIAVQAGISLVTSGAALAMDGSTIKTTQTAPTLPVTPVTAAAIIQNFGPLPSPPGTTADDLNTKSLASVKGPTA